MSLPAAFYDHVGIVTNDTVRTAELWSALLGIQVPATFNNAGPAGNLSHNGVHTDANILGAYIGCNALAGLEILQPTDTFSSAWLDQLRLFGTSPYYLGFASDTWTEADLAAKQATFTAVGCPAVQAGYWWNSPGHRGCYRYMACQSTAFGAPIEPTGPVGSATVLAPPSWWHDGLQRFGPSVHLLGFIVDDVEEATRRLASHGIDVLQRGPCYAYLDSLDALGLVVEVQAEGCAE